MSVTLGLKQDVCEIKSETRCMWHYVWNKMYVALRLKQDVCDIKSEQDVCDIKSETRCLRISLSVINTSMWQLSP